MALSFKLLGKTVTLSHIEDVVALRVKDTLRRALSPAKINKRFNTATAKDDSDPVTSGPKLPARGRRAFENSGWLFCQAEKGLKRAAERRVRLAETDAVMPVFVDHGGNTLVGTNLVVVQLPPKMNDKQVRQKIKDEGLKVVRKLGFGANIFEARLPARKPFDEALAELQASPAFVFAEPSFLRVLTGRHTPNDPDFDEQWQHPTIGSQAAWDRTMGQGVRLAVIDNGFQVNHPDLQAGVVGGGYFESDGFGNATFVRFTPGETFPDDDHGTFCLGMAGARSDNNRGGCGSAPQADLLVVGCLPDQIGTQATLARAVAYAADPTTEDPTASASDGADVVACSLGPSDGADWDLTSVLDLALQHAAANGRGRRGVPIFWAVSNGPVSISLDQVVSHPDVIAVGRSNQSDDADGSAFGAKLEMLAPGRSVYSTKSGSTYGTKTGTSFATPLTAGVAALVLSRNPQFTRDELREHLRQACDKVGGVAYDANGHHDQFGFGRVNADRATQ